MSRWLLQRLIVALGAALLVAMAVVAARQQLELAALRGAVTECAGQRDAAQARVGELHIRLGSLEALQAVQEAALREQTALATEQRQRAARATSEAGAERRRAEARVAAFRAMPVPSGCEAAVRWGAGQGRAFGLDWSGQ